MASRLLPVALRQCEADGTDVKSGRRADGAPQTRQVGLPVIRPELTVVDYAQIKTAARKLGSWSDSQFSIEFRGQVHNTVLDDQHRFPDITYVCRGITID